MSNPLAAAATKSESILNIDLSPSASDDHLPRTQKELDQNAAEKLQRQLDIGRMEILTGIKSDASEFHASHSNESIAAPKKQRNYSFAASEYAIDSVSHSQYLLADADDSGDVQTKDMDDNSKITSAENRAPKVELLDSAIVAKAPVTDPQRKDDKLSVVSDIPSVVLTSSNPDNHNITNVSIILSQSQPTDTTDITSGNITVDVVSKDTITALVSDIPAVIPPSSNPDNHNITQDANLQSQGQPTDTTDNASGNISVGVASKDTFPGISDVPSVVPPLLNTDNHIMTQDSIIQSQSTDTTDDTSGNISVDVASKDTYPAQLTEVPLTVPAPSVSDENERVDNIEIQEAVTEIIQTQTIDSSSEIIPVSKVASPSEASTTSLPVLPTPTIISTTDSVENKLIKDSDKSAPDITSKPELDLKPQNSREIVDASENKQSDSLSISNSIAFSIPLEKLDRDSQRSSLSSITPKKSYDVGVKLLVLKPYHAQDLDEVDLDVGDILEIEETPMDDFWIKGIFSNPARRNNGQRGFFPKEHTTFYDPEKGHPNNIPNIGNEAASSESPVASSSSIQPVPKGTAVIALYPYEPTKQDELQFAAGATIIVTECPEGGWWKGFTGIDNKNSQSGWFPANLVKPPDDKKIDTVKEEEFDQSADNFSHQKQVSWFKRLRNGETVVSDAPLNTLAKRGRSVTNPVHSFLSLSPMMEGSMDSLAPRKKTETFEIKSVGSPDDYVQSRPSVTIVKESHGGVSIQEDSSVSKGRASISSRGTMIISGVLSQAEIMQGATEEKVVDKISPSLYKFMTEQEKKRLSVVWELVQTERDYVRDLTIIIDVFMKPMANMPSLGVKNIQTLFANVEQILAVNTDFLVQMIQIEDIRNITAFAEIFLTMGERFMCYIPYCSNQQSSSAKFLKSLLTKGEVKTFLDDMQKNPVVRQLDLPGFLLKPVQRICKYPLLLKELIKNTPADHSDLVVLNRAIERMQNAVATINECAKRLNGMKPVLEVQNRFSEKINIANANRFLVREDVIQVLFSNGKKSRKLFLFNDLLILARKDWRDKHHVIEKTSIKDIRVCDISETSGSAAATPLMELEILPSSEFDMPNRYIISAPSLSDKQYWLDAYKSLVRYHVKSKNITDITMTSSNADGGDDDDISKEPTEADKKAAIDAAAETQKKPLLQKIELMEKIVLEKENTIKDWESKVLVSEGIHKKVEEELSLKVQELTAKLRDSENALAKALADRSKYEADTDKRMYSLSSELEKEKMTLNSEIVSLRDELKEKIEIIDNGSAIIEQLSDEKSNMISRIHSIALTMGIRIPSSKNKSFSSLQQLRPSVSHNMSSRESNIGLNHIDKAMEILLTCENGIEDLMRQLSDKTSTLNEKNDQLSLLKREFAEKDVILSNSVSSFQKKLAESDQIQSEYSIQLVALKKDKISLEASVEEQKTSIRKLNVEYENNLFEIRAQMKREADKSKTVNDQLEEITKTLQTKEALLKQTTIQLEQLSHRLQSTQGDISEKDTAVKQLMDRSNSMKETLEEIQLVLERAKAECAVDFPVSGGLIAQIKTFLFGINNALSDSTQRLISLEKAKNIEIQDLQSVNLRLKDKIAEKKQELEDATSELDNVKTMLHQLKSNLEQSRTTIEQMKASSSVFEKQTLCNLDDSKREVMSLTQKLAESQTLLYTIQASKADLEKKVLDHSATIQALSSSNEGLFKKVKEKEILISELESTISSKDEAYRTIAFKCEQIQKNFDFASMESEKQAQRLHSELNDERQTNQSYKFRANAEINDLKHELSRLKVLLAEAESKIESCHHVTEQRDNRILELEHSQSELTTKTHEFESMITHLNGKLASKESKLQESETDLSSRAKQINNLQSRIEELNGANSSLKVKIGELEAVAVGAESEILFFKSSISKLEQRLADVKNSSDQLSETLKTSERERKETLQDVGKLLHENANLTREGRQLRDQISELTSSIQKLESKLSSSQREADLMLSNSEERYKQTILKLRSEMEQELASCKSAHYTEKQALSKEITDVNQRVKHYESTLEESSRQSESSIETMSKKIIDLKATHLLEVDSLHLKQNSIVQQLKQDISNLGEQLSKSEKSILTKDFICKTLEREALKLRTANEKLDDELEKLRSQLKSLDESHNIRHRDDLGLIDEKTRLIQRKEAELEGMAVMIEEKNTAISQLKFQAQITDQELDEARKRVDSLSSFLKENEARLLSENSSLKGKRQDLEIQYHESLLLIERMKAAEDSSKATIENMTAEVDTLKKTLLAQTNICNELSLYKADSIIQTEKYVEIVEKKDLELLELRDCVKRIQKEGKKALKAELEALRSDMLNKHNQIFDQELLAHEAEVERLSGVILEAEEKTRHEKFLNAQLEAKLAMRQTQISDLEIRKKDLESKTEELLINLNNLEMQYNELKQDHSLKVAQFINDINFTKQQLTVTSTEGLKTKEDLKYVSSQTKSLIDQLEQESEVKKSSIVQLEAQVNSLQKSSSKASKALAAYNLAFSEISQIMQVTVPDKIEPPMIISLVSVIRQNLEDKAKLEAKLKEQEVIAANLTAKNHENHELLILAKKEAEYLESKSVENDAIYTQSLEVLKTNTQTLQEKLQGMAKDYALYKRQYKSASDNLARLMDQKALLEKDYILLYEKMQEMKADFETRSKSLTADTAALIDQNNRTTGELHQLQEKNQAMSEKIKQLVLERHIMLDQRANCDSLLARNKLAIGQISTKLDQILGENSELQTQNSNLIIELRAQSEKKNAEIGELKMEISRAQSKISNMQGALKDANLVLEEFQLKVHSISKREKELERVNQSLVRELAIANEKGTSVEYVSVDEGSTILRKQLEAAEQKVREIKKENSFIAHELSISNAKMSPVPFKVQPKFELDLSFLEGNG